MKKKLMAIAAMTVLSFTSFAAANLSVEQRETFIESLVQFMQEALDMSPLQRDKFKPLYRDYLMNIHSNHHLLETENKKEMTKEQVMHVIRSRLDFNRNLIDAQEKVVEKLSEFMTPEQLVDFMKTETRIIEKIRKTRKLRAENRK